jgi:hypothetical protein
MTKRKPKMLTIREAATVLNKPEASVRVWVNRGRFPGAKKETSPIGDYWLIPETDLESFETRRAGRPSKKREKSSGKG